MKVYHDARKVHCDIRSLSSSSWRWHQARLAAQQKGCHVPGGIQGQVAVHPAKHRCPAPYEAGRLHKPSDPGAQGGLEHRSILCGERGCPVVSWGWGAGHEREGLSPQTKQLLMAAAFIWVKGICSLVTHVKNGHPGGSRQGRDRTSEHRCSSGHLWKRAVVFTLWFTVFCGIPGNWTLWFCPPWGTHIFPVCTQVARWVTTKGKKQDYAEYDVSGKCVPNPRIWEAPWIQCSADSSVSLTKKSTTTTKIHRFVLFYSHCSISDTGNFSYLLNSDARFENQFHLCV